MLEGPRRLRPRDVDEPREAPGTSAVRVELTGIGGSEYLGYANPGIRPLPAIMGHGIVGRTDDGKRVLVDPLRSCGACRHCTDGARQLCESWALIGVQSPGGFAERVAVPDGALVPLPDDLDPARACFVEPFANAVNAWERSGAKADDRVAILGAGGLGLGLVACARAAGCGRVRVIDPAACRRDAALALGAAEVDTASGKRESGGYAVVFDTVGSAPARAEALRLTGAGGCCTLLGFAGASMTFDAVELIRRQLRIVGSFVYSRAQFERAVELARRTESGWVSVVRFDGVEPLLERFLDGDFDVVRAALAPDA